MKKIISTILVLTLLIFSACSTNTSKDVSQDNSPNKDLVITLERTGMYTMPEYAHNFITISKDGFETKISHYDGTLTEKTFTKFENGEFEKLIEIFETNNFENLELKYNSQVPIADIGLGIITYKNKSVNINPYIGEGNPNEISNIISAISDILYNQNNQLQKDQDNNSFQTLTYNGVQCEKTPWNEWYESGEIQFFKAPTQKDLIPAYYSTKYNIQIENVKEISNGLVCQACDICPSSNHYKIQVDKLTDITELLNDKWELN